MLGKAKTHHHPGGRHQLKIKMSDAKNSNSRMRNDSGCFDDDCASSTSSGGNAPDFLSAHWDEVVGQWAGKNHSIIAQEAVRMKKMTDERRAELNETRDPAERARIAQRWRDEVADVMAFTQDLIQCVANDVTEMSLSPAASRDEEAEACMTSQDLGKIIEEELFDGDDDEDADNDEVKMFLVRTKRKRRPRRRHAHASRRNSHKRRDSGEIEMDDGAILLSEQSFTIQVDRVQRERAPDPMEREVRSGCWQWRKDLDSTAIWGHHDQDEIHSSVEDIYSDWLSMQRRRPSRNFVPEDISEVFWSISLEDHGPVGGTGRRFSEVLENLPFTDRPDILEDRCELLEGDKRRTRRFKKVRPQKMYWNIFSEWRKIFREEEAPSTDKKARRRPKKKPRKYRQKRQRRSSKNGTEDYFNEFRHHFNEAPLKPRRRSLDTQQSEQKAKRIKLTEQHDEWELIKVKKTGGQSKGNKTSVAAAITKTIERKILAAFVSPDESSVEDATEAAIGARPLQESFDAWPKSVARRIRKSRRRFDKLREKMHKMREARRRSVDLNMDAMAAFEEWRWNLEEAEVRLGSEDYFEEWRVLNMVEEEEDNQYEGSIVERKTRVSKPTAVGKIGYSHKADSNNKKRATQKSNLMSVRPKAAKKQLRLAVKCCAKQPIQRGLVLSAKVN